MNSSISLTRNEKNEIEEDISSLFLSVDRHVSGPQFEMFGFLSRTTDDFLSIDQRYETGIGAVVNYWEAKKTREGAKRDGKLEAGSDWMNCFDTIQAFAEDKSKSSAAAIRGDELDKALRVAGKVLLKEHSVFRAAFLMGVFGEVEQAAIDTFAVNDQGWRLEFRPTLQFRPVQAIRLRADLYFKYGIRGFAEPDSLIDEIIQEYGVFTDLGADLRTRLELSASIELKGVELTLTYEGVRDHIPPFAISEDGRPIVAAYKRNRTQFKVVIPL
jgi:hypothetical protein